MAEIEIGSITEAELVQALERALVADDNPEGALTTNELADLTGWHERTVLRALRKLKRAGRLEIVRVQQLDLADRMTKVPAYRLRQN